MVTIDNIRVISPSLTSLIVSWEIYETWEDLGPYHVNIYRSNTPQWDTSSFVLIASGLDPATTSEYEDTSVSGYLTNLWQDFYYTVVPIITTSNVSGLVPNPTRLQTEMNLTAKEIIRRKDLALLPRYGGSTFFLLKRKKTGTRCTNCWDSIIQRRTKTNCATCYDTNWVGGYFPPITFYGSLGGAPRRTLIHLFGEWETQDSFMKTTSYPIISPQDVVVDIQNRRWRVLDMQPIEKNQYTITQQVRLTRVSNLDVVQQYLVSGVL